MIKNNIKQLLQLRNKSINWLSTEIGVTYSNTYKIVNNETTSIRYDVLEKLMIALGVTSFDLIFSIEKEQD